MAARKDLKPGDMVYSIVQRHSDAAVIAEYALVIGIDHPRDPGQGHFGCEERVKVMWSDPIRFDTVCDCGLEPIETLLHAPEKKCIDGEKSVKQGP